MDSITKLSSKRNNSYDIAKALGIISIVIGHCHPNAAVIAFVYSYHLALFLFMSGVQYNINKYSIDPYLFIQNRIKSMWTPYFGYLTFFTLTHDFSSKLHLIGEPSFGIKALPRRILNNFIMQGGEILGGALWFIPVMFITLAIFGAIVYISYKHFYKIRLIPIVSACLFIAYWGVHCNMNSIELPFHLHTGLLLIPVVLAGFLLRYFNIDFSKFFRWYFAIPCVIISYLLVVKYGYHIELSAETIAGSAGLFYLITFLGIYFIGALSTLLGKHSLISRILAFIGKYSFDIMALHFLVIKIVDMCYGRLMQHTPDSYSVFPRAYPHLWPIYLILSVVAIPWIKIGLNKTFTMITNLLTTNVKHTL